MAVEPDGAARGEEEVEPIEFAVPMTGGGGTTAHVAALARLLAEHSTRKVVVEYDLGPDGADAPWVSVRSNWRLGCWMEVHGHDDPDRTVAPNLDPRLAALGFDPPGTWPETPTTHNRRFHQPVPWDHIARSTFTILRAMGLTEHDTLRIAMFEFSDFQFTLYDGGRIPDPTKLDASQEEMDFA